jgi:hypothetical protein
VLADFRPNLGALRHHARAYPAQRTATVFLNTAAFTANAGDTAILPKTIHGDPVSLVQLMRRPVERKIYFETVLTEPTPRPGAPPPAESSHPKVSGPTGMLH